MQAVGKDKFESALREQLPNGAPDKLVQLLVEKSETPMWQVQDAALGWRGQVYVIPDDALRDFSLAANLAAVAELGVGLDGMPRGVAWATVVNVVYAIYKVISQTSKLSQQERQVMVALTMASGTPESIQRRLESASVLIPTNVVTATLDRFKDLGLARPGPDRHWRISTEIYNEPS